MARDEADTGDDPELETRAAIKTVDSSSDTSLDDVNDMSSTIHNAPRNEILYLQVLLSGATRIIRKAGVLPIVCYVDVSTSTSKVEKSSAAYAREADENLEDLILRLKLEGKFPMCGHFVMLMKF